MNNIFKILINNGKEISLKKRTFILEAGQISTKVYFIKKGVVRHYIIDSNGNKKTIKISKENDFFYCSIISFFTDEATYIYCQTLTEVELVFWDREKLDILSRKYPEINTFRNQKLIDFIVQKHKKELSLLANGARERIEEFNVDHKELFNRIPHHIIASYLNISPETLSRLRKKR